MYGRDTYDIYNYDIKYNVEYFIIKYRNFPLHFVRGMFEKLVRLLVGWHTKLKNWQAVWHVGTFIGTLTRWHVKMVC